MIEFPSYDEANTFYNLGVVNTELGDFTKAITYYEKALSEASDNTFIKPLLLMKSGNIALELNKKSKARKFFQEIKEDYPDSQQASEIEIKLAQVE